MSVTENYDTLVRFFWVENYDGNREIKYVWNFFRILMEMGEC